MKYENYYLDLEKVSKLTDKDSDRIHGYYTDMMHHFNDDREKIATSIFNTLNEGGYLKEIRTEKIEKILS
jgi:DNA-directed RNA polymerase specialized sigma54-like protein